MEYTLEHTGTTGSARWLWFEWTCGNVDPEDSRQLVGILLAENMVAEAAQIVEEMAYCN